jgi:aminotransferase
MNIDSFICERVKCVPPSGIRKFFDIASEMKDCISLGIGEPDFITPWNIREEAIYAMERGVTHYTSNWGTTELRKLIAAYVSDRIHVDYDISSILVTTGTSEALDLVFRVILEEGDEVLIPAPSYVSYMPGVVFAGGVPKPIVTREEDDFKLTRDILAGMITDRTKAVVIPFPNNPTGAVMSREDYEGIADLLLQKDLIVISDEIYGELTYSGEHFSIARLPGFKERTVMINGFSKGFAMTGFRLGFAAGPRALLEAMCKVHQYSMLCAPAISQAAGKEAIKSEMDSCYAQVKAMVKEYNRRRLYIYNTFNEMGLHCFEPMGAFYVFPNITGTGLTSDQFCERLLYGKKVACVPGTAFGDAGEGFIRCSYASSLDNIKEALKRIREFISEL